MSAAGPKAAVGIDFLLEELDGPANDMALKEITVEPGFNPRRMLSDKAFESDALSAMVESIRDYGVMVPLLVRRKNGKIVLIAGERRYHAAVAAGVQRVPVRILDVDDQRALEIAIIENAQRKDLDLVTETLVGFEFLSARMRMPVAEVVSYLNAVRNERREDDLNVEQLLRSVYGTGVTTWLLRRAPILKMSPQERTAIQQGNIDLKACSELVKLPPGTERENLLRQAIDEQLNARQVKSLVNAILDTTGTPPGLASRVQTFKKILSKVARLKGKDAERAEALITELETQFNQLLKR